MLLPQLSQVSKEIRTGTRKVKFQRPLLFSSIAASVLGMNVIKTPEDQ